jgi:hypothetical protein
MDETLGPVVTSAGGDFIKPFRPKFMEKKNNLVKFNNVIMIFNGFEIP